MSVWFLRATLIALLGIFSTHSVAAATTGFLSRSVRIGAEEYRYQVYVPREYRAGKKTWPVILALHGGGEYGRDGNRQTEGGLARAIRRNPERVPAIVVFPQSPPDGTPGFQKKGAAIALAALDHTLQEFSADRSRIYLTGLSMGGNGTWYLANHHPDRFAALVVVCGFIQSMQFSVNYPAIAPVHSADPYAAIAKKIAHIPIWIFHGDIDPTVPVSESRRMASALKAAGAKVHYTELRGVGHNAWDPAYESAELFAWLFRQRRS